MWTSAELKIRAKGAFYKNYWHCVLTALVMAFCSGLSYDVIKNIQEHGYDRYSDTFLGSIGDFIMQPFFMMFDMKIFFWLMGVVILFVKVFLGNPLCVGGYRFFIMNQTMNPSAAELGYGMRSQSYTNIVLTMFLKNLYTSLWGLLFVIPGIIKYYEYLMVPYILAENPEMDRQEAFLISKRMMTGQKMNAFVLDLSFIGWMILSGITGGIVGIFL